MSDPMPLVQLAREEFLNKETLLRKPSQEVQDFGVATEKIIGDLVATFESEAIAVGLAAPQIGIMQRISVINIKKGKPGPHLVLLNPRITWSSRQTEMRFESCMSLPHFRGKVERPTSVKIAFQDLNGKVRNMEADGFLARVIQHEIDHLEGVLYVDRMASLDELEPVDFFRK
jgi:peptide deformylase